MLVTTVNQNIYPKMFNSISILNAKTNTLNAIAELRKNMNYIKKFGLPANVAQHINF